MTTVNTLGMTPEEFLKARERAIRALEKRSEYDHQHYLATKVEKLERVHQNYIDNIDKVLQYHHRRGQTQKIKVAAQQKKCHDKNKKAIAAQQHEHYQKIRDRVLAHHRLYCQKHPEQMRAKYATRRARMLGADGYFTAEEFRIKCAIFRNVCVYCGKAKQLGPDHVVPISKGGSNYIKNILPACISCNSSKGARTFEEYLIHYTEEKQKDILMRIYIAEHPKESEKLLVESCT